MMERFQQEAKDCHAYDRKPPSRTCSGCGSSQMKCCDSNSLIIRVLARCCLGLGIRLVVEKSPGDRSH